MACHSVKWIITVVSDEACWSPVTQNRNIRTKICSIKKPCAVGYNVQILKIGMELTDIHYVDDYWTVCKEPRRVLWFLPVTGQIQVVAGIVLFAHILEFNAFSVSINYYNWNVSTNFDWRGCLRLWLLCKHTPFIMIQWMMGTVLTTLSASFWLNAGGKMFPEISLRSLCAPTWHNELQPNTMSCTDKLKPFFCVADLLL